MDRRLRAAVAFAAAALVLLPGGCGIPDDTKVTVVGAGPSGGPAISDDGIPPVPNTRISATDPAQLVDYYLEAAAGDPERAIDRVKAFLSADAQAGFEAGPDVRVIRLKNTPLYSSSNPEITFSAQQIGTLKSNGVLEPTPPAQAVTTEYKLQVGPIAGQTGYFVTEAPHFLLLRDTALNSYYQRRTIYFWNNENTALVPDLRYMPRSVPTVFQPTKILNWLVNGPASWLADAAHGLPNGTTSPDNVPAATNGTLQVSLSPQALPAGDPGALDRLRRQLQWSLRLLVPHTLELTIGHQDPVNYSGEDYRTSNLAYRLAEVPERFVIYNEAVHRMANSPQDTEPIPVLKAADNKAISAAALSTSSTHTFLAVVAGSGKKTRLRVASAGGGQQTDLKDVPGLSGTLGRPVWAVTADNDPNGAIGLITVNGRLYTFAPDGSPAKRLDWQGNPGPITAVSVAPDGHRIALVSGGRLYRTVLVTGEDALTLSTPEQLMPPTFSKITAVAWSSETYLAVAGLSDDGRRYAVMDVSIDGALTYTRLDNLGKDEVTYLTAYPANPTTRYDNANTESYEAAGKAWDVLGQPVLISTADLASPPATPPVGVTPVAPFFLD